MPFKVEKPEDTEHLNVIIYGDTGSGKTYLCGTAAECPTATPALIIDIEGGTKTLRGVNIDIVRPNSWEEIQDIYDYLRHDNNKYKLIAVDSLTELQRKFSMGIIMGDIDKEARYNDLEKTTTPNRQDWLRTGDQMRKVIRAFRDLSYLPDVDKRVHVIMTALEKHDEKKNCTCPQLPGALGAECGAFVDVLARLSHIQTKNEETEESESKRHLLVDEYINAEGTKYLAKNRGGRLKQIWMPTIEKILHLWEAQE
jgi:hypothetical protein